MNRFIILTVILTPICLNAGVLAQTPRSTDTGTGSINEARSEIDKKLIQNIRAVLDFDAAISPQEKALIVSLASSTKNTRQAVVSLIINDEGFADRGGPHISCLMKAVTGLDPFGKQSDQLFVDHVAPVVFNRDSSPIKLLSAEMVLGSLRISDERASLMIDRMIKDRHLALSDVTLPRILTTGTKAQLESMSDLIIDSYLSGTSRGHLHSIEVIGEKLSAEAAAKYVSRLVPRLTNAAERNNANVLGALLSAFIKRLDALKADELASNLIGLAKRNKNLLLEHHLVFQSLAQRTSTANVLEILDLYLEFAVNQTEDYPVNVCIGTIDQLVSVLKQPELNAAAKQIFLYAEKDNSSPASRLPESLYGQLKELNDQNSSLLVEYSASTFKRSFRVQIQCDLLMELAPFLREEDADNFSKHILRKFKYSSSNDFYKLSELLKPVWKNMSSIGKDEFRAEILKHLDRSKNKKKSLQLVTSIAPFYPPNQAAGFSGLAKDAVEQFVSTSDQRELFVLENGLKGIGPWLDQESALPLLNKLVDHLEEEKLTTKFPVIALSAVGFSKNVDAAKLKKLFDLIAERALVEQNQGGLSVIAKAIRDSASKWDSAFANQFAEKLVERIDFELSPVKIAMLANIFVAVEPLLSIETKQVFVGTLLPRIPDFVFAENVIAVAKSIAKTRSTLSDATKVQAANDLVDGLANAIPERRFASMPDIESESEIGGNEYTNLAELLQHATFIKLVNALKSPFLDSEVELMLVRSLEEKAGQKFANPRSLAVWAGGQKIDLSSPFEAKLKKKQLAEYPEFDELVVTPVSQSSSPSQFINFHVVNRFAYIAAATSGIEIIDLSKQNSQKTISRKGLGQTTMAVYVVGEKGYVTSGPFGVPSAFLKIVDISDKKEPKLTGKIRLPDYPSTVEVRDKIAYVADHSEGLRIIDVSDPANPKEIGAYTSPGFVLDVKLFGKYALLADKEVGLRIVDISDPRNPVQVSQARTKGPALNLALQGKRVFVACGDKGVMVLDLSNPEKPKYLTTLGMELAISVSAYNDFLAVGALGLGCRIFDISELNSPKERRLKVNSSVNCVFLEENSLYLTEVNTMERRSYFRVYSLSRTQTQSSKN